MLVELRVTGLGVIDDQAIVLGPGMTALTGETGAGKTLLVDAIALLTGASADPNTVGAGAAEAVVEGRFVLPAPAGAEEPAEPDETVLTRVVPAGGRSRSYVDGRMVPAAQLAERTESVVDIHGQHAHQSLLSAAAQRAALDQAGGIDTSEVEAGRRKVRDLRAAQSGMGGDARERARRLDLLKYQLDEMDRAGLDDPDEDDALQQEEELLADASGLVQRASEAWEGLAGDGGVTDRLGEVVAATGHHRPLAVIHDRLVALQEELADAAADARRLAESVEEDPHRLSEVGERRRVLTELRRKYGGTLAEVIDYRDGLRKEVEDLEDHDERAARLEEELHRTQEQLASALTRLRDARRAAAASLATAIETELRELAMPRARFSIEVGDDPAAESVTWLLSANPGQPLLPLAKVASGGELARAMLAARLVTGRRKPAAGRGGGRTSTLVFDEVDAGIGGEAATAVGRALAALAEEHQVLVVTHLAQVAAFADQHVSVSKRIVVGSDGEESTVAVARPLTGEDRVVELARMLSGRPDSDSARHHAGELLEAAAGPRSSDRHEPAPSPGRGSRRG